MPDDHDRRTDREPPPGDTGRRLAEDSDMRTTLANERTLLAWSRTSLALLAASFAVVKLTDIAPSGLRLALGSYLVILGTAVLLFGYAQWRLRQSRIHEPPLPGNGLGGLVLTLAMFLLAGFVITVIIVAP